jgi:hypothetical protein
MELHTMCNNVAREGRASSYWPPRSETPGKAISFCPLKGKNRSISGQLRSSSWSFFYEVVPVMPTGQTKELISIRLAPDIIRWFKKQGKGYQSRINAVLRAYVDAHNSAE